jgi:peptidyl-prolyl cis-trans isomerase B (cyclophilin B)
MSNLIKGKIVLEGGSAMSFELYPDVAPKSVANFVKLAESGFYDGLTFHRIVPGFVIQGGDPLGNGTGGPGWTIPGEFAANGFVQNTLRHTRGVLSMARTNVPDSASSQFFLMHRDSPHLDAQYAAFGKVIEGEEVIDAIATVRTTTKMRYYQDWPVDDVVIESMEMLHE